MKSRHSQGSISRYTTHSWKNSVEACVVTTISRFARAEYALHSEDFRKLNIFERKGRGGKLDFVETMDRRNRLLLLSILRLTIFLNNLSSFLLSSRRDVMTPRLKKGLITWIGIFFPLGVDYWLIIQMIEYSYFIQSRFMFSVCDDCLPGKFQFDFIIVHRIPHSFLVVLNCISLNDIMHRNVRLQCRT